MKLNLIIRMLCPIIDTEDQAVKSDQNQGDNSAVYN